MGGIGRRNWFKSLGSLFAVLVTPLGVHKLVKVDPSTMQLDETVIWEAPNKEKIIGLQKFGESLIIATETRVIELCQKK